MVETIFSLFGVQEKRLSLMEQLCVRSFLIHGHEFELYTYGNIDEVPKGVRILPAQDILPRSLADQYVMRSGNFKGLVSPFSDLFRLKALAERGGMWVDMDIVCVAPFDFQQSHILASERALDGASKVTNSVMKAPAGDGFIQELLEKALQVDPTSIKHTEIGAKLMPAAVTKFGLEQNVVPPECFCPVDWWEWYKLFRDNPELPIGTHGIHLWNSFWLINKIDKDQLHPETTLYGQLQRKYL